MLSISSRKVPGSVVKSVLSSVAGNPVNNRATLRNAIANIAGYTSYEQAKALNSRGNMIMDSLWMEKSVEHMNNWVVRAVNYLIVLDPTKDFITIENLDGWVINRIDIPSQHTGFSIDTGLIDFCPKDKKITIRISSTYEFIVIQRSSQRQIDVSVKTSLDSLSVSEEFTEDDFNEVGVWMNDSLQIPRMLAECVMICENNQSVVRALESHGMTHDQIEASENTALWLFEKNKGITGPYVDELEPAIKNYKAMGFVAHMYLEHYYNDNRKGTTELCESMDIHLGELADMQNRAKAEADWFLLTNY